MFPSFKKLSAFSLIALSPFFLRAQDELPLNKRRLSDRVLVVWVADSFQTIGVVALATEKGIVTVDANLSRSNDVRIRRAISEEFGRDDFKYLINTHYHHDHTGGNQAYADCGIIGHINCPAGMKRELTGNGLSDLVGRFQERLEVRRKEYEKIPADSPESKYTREELLLLEQAVDELQHGFIPTYPDILFEKNLVLDMGDMTLELYSFGTCHTDSDIILFVPEEGLVALGDFFPGVFLPYFRKESMAGFETMMEHWGRIMESGIELKHVTMAHWDMPHSVEAFKEQYRYLKTLRDGLKDLQKQGKTLEDAKAAFSIERDFPYFRDKRTRIRDIDLHLNNVEVLWDWLYRRQGVSSDLCPD